MLPANSPPVSAATFFRDRERHPVHRLEVLFAPDQAQLFPVAVIGECLDHIGAGMREFAVQLFYQFRMLEDHFGHEGAGLQIAAPFEFEQITLGADHRSLCQPVHEAQFFLRLLPCAWLGLFHRGPPAVVCTGGRHARDRRRTGPLRAGTRRSRIILAARLDPRPSSH
jgi:hypothetical protein